MPSSYTKEDFAEVLSGFDVVLDSRGRKNLERSLTILKPADRRSAWPARRTPGSQSSSGPRGSWASRWGC